MVYGDLMFQVNGLTRLSSFDQTQANLCGGACPSAAVQQEFSFSQCAPEFIDHFF
jgi:hypothetical protein